MISSAPLPQAAALLFVIVANALVANTAPAAAFLHPPATAAPRPRGTWTSSSIHRANNEVADLDLARSARRHETTATAATTTATTTTSLRLFRNVFGRDGAAHDLGWPNYGVDGRLNESKEEESNDELAESDGDNE